MSVNQDPTTTVDQIITLFDALSRTNPTRITAEITAPDGGVRLDMQGLKRHGKPLSLRHYAYINRRHELVDETPVDANYTELRINLLTRVMNSALDENLTEITVRADYPQQTLASAAQISWNLGHGKILLGRLH